MNTDTQKITAADMEKYLYKRYCDSYEWVFLTQVRSSTGTANRIADAMAFNMFGSTGYEILGFEIKVSRSDWLSELKHMSKSNELMEYCDKWFLVVSDPDIVKEGELPKNWGLLVLKGDKLVMKVRPTPQKTAPIPLHFMASILRRGATEVERIRSQYIAKESIAKQIQEAELKGYEKGRGYNGRQTEELLKELRNTVQVFEKASGIEITGWNAKGKTEEIGKYVKVALEMNSWSMDCKIKEIERTAALVLGGVTELKKIKKLMSETTTK
ncbi:hypothetical protein A2Z56_02600 [Candidatus Kaiserbacteria bacterium RIFCSPHIGHO2_12_45_16]|nr:MAG: hypothetical protein A2Z56_02600 [Candidatus Kaiserbacteria bacterium RIFCSPHIGHO2_12_45_16]